MVIAGFIFLLLSVATIKKPIVIDITDNGRKVAGIVGGLLLTIGIILFVYSSNNSDNIQTPNQTSTLIPAQTPIQATLTPTQTITPAPIQTITLTPIQSSPDSHLEVLSLYTQQFARPEDRPPSSIPIAIPRHIITNGKSYARAGNELHVWIVICPLISPVCNIKELKLDAAGDWTDTIDIGTKDECSSLFDVYFVLASKEVNGLFDTFKQTGIRRDEYESFEYEDKDTFIVVRSLKDNGIEPCQ